MNIIIPNKTYLQAINAIAYKKRIIAQVGGTRSGKTFGNLQTIKTITEKKTKRIITVVSHSLPHLEGGAIRDFDNILESFGIMPDSVRTKHPYIYTLGNSIIEFIGFDRPSKAIGATRDILFVNEANKLPHDIVHQLMIRTTEFILLDWNPANEFWFDTEGYEQRESTQIIHSTYLDNIENITKQQYNELMIAKEKHDIEVSLNVFGYWYNYWRVYGLGLKGKIEGAILQNWEYGEFIPQNTVANGLDFGVKNPDAMIKISIARKEMKIYCKEVIYKTGLSTHELSILVSANVMQNELIIADSAGLRTINDLKAKGFNIRSVEKNKIIEDIKTLMDYVLVVDPESVNLARELKDWVWLDKKGQVPIDANNHLIDALRYIACTLIKPKIRKGQKF